MKLSLKRTLSEMREVMLDPAAAGLDPVYEVWTELPDHFWINKTVVFPGRLGKEFTKTYGHFHSTPVEEVYYVTQGKGILVLENEREVLLVRAEMGDEIIISPEFGHSWSNVGKDELVLFDNWSIPHSPSDYAEIKRLHGMVYYLTEKDGEIELLANPNYQTHPSPVWLTAKELSRRQES